MGIQIHFDRFHDRIKLCREDSSYSRARELDDSIKKDISTAFRKARHPLASDFIRGSFSTHTGIVPISGVHDIDRGLVLDTRSAPKNPVLPKKKALAVLESRGLSNARIKRHCITAYDASENIHIDLAIYQGFSGMYKLAKGKKYSNARNRKWSRDDPDGLVDWINDDSDYGSERKEVLAQFRRLVRYLKRWRDVQFDEERAARIPSIGLTIMVKDQLRWSFGAGGHRQDLRALRKTVEAILNSRHFGGVSRGLITLELCLPTRPWDVVFGKPWIAGEYLYRRLLHLRRGLAEAEGLIDERHQCMILNKFFGSDFKAPTTMNLIPVT